MKPQKKHIILLAIILLAGFFILLKPSYTTRAHDQATPNNFVPDEIIIKLNDFKLEKESYTITSGLNTGFFNFDRLNTKYNVSSIEKVIKSDISNNYKISADEEKFRRSSYLYKITTDSHVDINTIINDYQQSYLVEYAEPNYIQRIAITPDDTFYSSLWGLNNTGQDVAGYSGTADADIDAAEAWTYGTGESTVTVAIIDSGADMDHPDLEDNLIAGYDYVNDDNDADDDNDHGSHVAGIIGAVGNNGAGVTGVNWSIKMKPYKVFNDEGVGSSFDFIQAFSAAVSAGIKLVNYSGGGESYSQASYDAISDGNDNGTLLIAAAMNESLDTDIPGNEYYPNNYDLDNILTVAATDQDDALASFSNYGTTSVDVAAPGYYIYSTIPDDDYGYMNGTSMATPYVTGIAALYLSENPDYTHLGLKQLIMDNVDTIASLADKVVTGGRVNALSMFSAADSVAPTGTISYSTTDYTTEDVIATLATSESVIISNNEGANTYTFTENGSFTFQFTDYAGNPGTAIATVNNIDTEAPSTPTGFLVYSDTDKQTALSISDQHSYPLPYFEWTESTDSVSGLKGYYVNFSSEITDEAEDGELQTENYFEPPKIVADGSYYLHVKAVDNLDNMTNGVYITYEYQPSRLIITGPKSNGGPQVRLFNTDGELVGQFMAYEESFTGGINVAVGDIDGNGINEIITSTREGGVPTIKIFDNRGNNLGWDFDAYDPAFRGGVNIGVGDIEGDGPHEIAVAPISGGSSNIRIFGLRNDEIVPTTQNFLAYDENFRGGIALSIADVEGDGIGDLVTSPTSRGGPHIRIFGMRNKQYVPVTLGIMAYDEDFRGGITSTAGDVNGDGKDETVTGIVSAGGPHVRIFGVGRSEAYELLSPGFMAFDPETRGGVTVATLDTNGNGFDEIITGIGGDSEPNVCIFDQDGLYAGPCFYAYSSTFMGGVTVAAGLF